MDTIKIGNNFQELSYKLPCSSYDDEFIENIKKN